MLLETAVSFGQACTFTYVAHKLVNAKVPPLHGRFHHPEVVFCL
jgi:hypothetical protein